MLKCRIKIDDKYYGGENIDAFYRPGYGGAACAWQTYAGEERDLPILEDENFLVIEGTRNLQSHLERIVRWMKDEVLSPERIEIFFEQRP